MDHIDKSKSAVNTSAIVDENRTSNLELDTHSYLRPFPSYVIASDSEWLLVKKSFFYVYAFSLHAIQM